MTECKNISAPLFVGFFKTLNLERILADRIETDTHQKATYHLKNKEGFDVIFTIEDLDSQHVDDQFKLRKVTDTPVYGKFIRTVEEAIFYYEVGPTPRRDRLWLRAFRCDTWSPEGNLIRTRQLHRTKDHLYLLVDYLVREEDGSDANCLQVFRLNNCHPGIDLIFDGLKIASGGRLCLYRNYGVPGCRRFDQEKYWVRAYSDPWLNLNGLEQASLLPIVQADEPLRIDRLLKLILDAIKLRSSPYPYRLDLVRFVRQLRTVEFPGIRGKLCQWLLRWMLPTKC